MADLSPRNMAYIKSKDPQLHDAIRDIVDSLNNIAQQTNAAAVGTIQTPEPHAALSVLGGGGIVDVAVTDNSPQYRGKEHFFDYSNDNGKTWHTRAMGPSKNWRGSLGSGKFIFRSYAQHNTSDVSPMIYHPEVDTSGTTEPAMQESQGSGTGSAGYGQVPYTGNKPPIR